MATKVALVTASSAGLGAATVKALARSGFNVVINYNSNKEKADAVMQDIQNPDLEGSSNNTSKCIVVKADMSQRGDIKQLVQTTIESFGRLDCVVSNQGWTQMRNFNDLDDNMEDADWDMCYNMNVKSHLHLFHAARPHLAKTNGSFTTIASLAGVIPSGSSIPYSVTKAAQIHLVKALAKVAAPEIRVNSIAPGILLTEWGKKFPSAKLDAAREKSALKKLADVDDVVRQIVFLATTQSMTGQNIVIDAGWSMG